MSNSDNIYSFAQSMPDGAEEFNIPKLLRRVANTIEGLEGITVHEATLHTSANDKPHMNVYYSASPTAPTEVKEYPIDSISRSLPKGKNQDKLSDLFLEMHDNPRLIKSDFIYDVVLNDEINENGSHYKLTVYLAKDDEDKAL